MTRPAWTVALGLALGACADDFTIDLQVPGDASTQLDSGFDVTTGDAAARDAGAATPCATSSQCASPSAPLCDPAANVCVQCLSSNDCSGNTPHCNGATNTCFSCVIDTDCNTGMVCNRAIPRCATKCTNGTECSGGPCSLAYGYCVECLSNSDCTTSSLLLCLLPPYGECVECVTSADCAKGKTCGANHRCG